MNARKAERWGGRCFVASRRIAFGGSLLCGGSPWRVSAAEISRLPPPVRASCGRGSNRVCCQAVLTVPGGVVLSMAFMMLSSLRTRAMMDDLGGFPSRLQAVREGLDHGVPPDGTISHHHPAATTDPHGPAGRLCAAQSCSAQSPVRPSLLPARRACRPPDDRLIRLALQAGST